MKHKKGNSILFILMFTIPLLLTFIYIPESVGMPNQLDENDSDLTKLCVNNVNGSMNPQLRGKGTYYKGDNTDDLIFSKYDYISRIPNFNYYGTKIRLYPKYTYIDLPTENIDNGVFVGQGNILGTPSDGKFFNYNGDYNGDKDYAFGSDIEAKVDKAQYETLFQSDIMSASASDIHSGYDYYNRFDDQYDHDEKLSGGDEYNNETAKILKKDSSWSDSGSDDKDLKIQMKQEKDDILISNYQTGVPDYYEFWLGYDKDENSKRWNIEFRSEDMFDKNGDYSSTLDWEFEYSFEFKDPAYRMWDTKIELEIKKDTGDWTSLFSKSDFTSKKDNAEESGSKNLNFNDYIIDGYVYYRFRFRGKVAVNWWGFEDKEGIIDVTFHKFKTSINQYFNREAIADEIELKSDSSDGIKIVSSGFSSSGGFNSYAEAEAKIEMEMTNADNSLNYNKDDWKLISITPKFYFNGDPTALNFPSKETLWGRDITVSINLESTSGDIPIFTSHLTSSPNLFRGAYLFRLSDILNIQSTLEGFFWKPDPIDLSDELLYDESIFGIGEDGNPSFTFRINVIVSDTSSSYSICVASLRLYKAEVQIKFETTNSHPLHNDHDIVLGVENEDSSYSFYDLNNGYIDNRKDWENRFENVWLGSNIGSNWGVLTSIKYPDEYQLDTTEHILDFTLFSFFPDQFHLKIDGELIDSGGYTKGELKSYNIDGYELGDHSIEIFLNQTNGLEKYFYEQFSVVENEIPSIQFIQKYASSLGEIQYESITAQMEYVRVKVRYFESPKLHSNAYLTEFDIDHRLPSSTNIFSWLHYNSPHLNNEDFFHYNETGGYSYLNFSLYFSDWSDSYYDFDGYIYELQIDYDEFYENRTIVQYENYPPDYYITSFYSIETHYYREIDFDFTGIYFIGAYVTSMMIESNPYPEEAIEREFLYFNESNDYPIWKTSYQVEIGTIGNKIERGSDVYDLLFGFKLDVDPPAFSDYTTYHSILDTYPAIFNLMGCSDTGGAGLYKAYLILQNNNTLERDYIELNQDGNDFWIQNEKGLIYPHNYTAWYGLIDKGGNWVTTPNFSLQINGSSIYLYFFNYPPEYLLDSVGNTLSFVMFSFFPDQYYVKIDDTKIDSGYYSKGQYKSYNIDGYSLGIHDIEIFLNQTDEGQRFFYGEFKVIQPPIFLDKPASEVIYADVYGLFNLNWDIQNNGLKNYTLMINNTIYREGVFLNPLLDNVTYFSNSSAMTIGEYNFKLIVRDIDGLEIIDEMTLIIEEYIRPILTLVSPTDLVLHKPHLQPIQISLIANYPIKFPNGVQWDFKHYTESLFDWSPLKDGAIYWEESINLLNFEASDKYQLWVNITDDITSTLYHWDIKVLPMLDYYFDDIDYTDSNIIVSYNSDETTIIKGEVLVTHNLSIREWDFEVFLPTKFADAHNYKIFRNFQTYYPSNFFSDYDHYSEWHLPSFAISDKVLFELEQPKLINSIPQKAEESEEIAMKFTLTSKHLFINLFIKNRVNYFLQNPLDYSVKLYYQYEGEYIEIEDFEVDFDKFIKFEFEWFGIEDGQEIDFLIVLIPTEEGEGLNLTMSLLIGLLTSASVGVIWVIATARDDVKKWDDTEWGKIGYILRTIGIIGGCFAGGFIIGLFI